MIGDVLFIRSFTPDFDGKFNKYQQALSDEDISWFFLGWDRSGEFESKYNKNSFFYRRKALIGGGWKNIFNIICWNWFAAMFLFKHRNDIKVLHIIDFDSAIFTFPLAKILKKKIVFDVYDKYSSMRRFPRLLKKLVDSYENLILKKSNMSILADESRLEQHSIPPSENIFIIENVPQDITIPKIDVGKKEQSSHMSIGYFGVLEKNNRGLEDTVNAIITLEKWEFHVAGYGELETFFKDMAKKYPNKIKFYGPQNSITGLSIMNNTDIILGLYYRNIPNHLYAAPNKYYEHLMLGKAMLTTIEIPPGKKVLKNNTGWAISEGKDNLLKFLSSDVNSDITEKSKNAHYVWGKSYKNYFHKHYKFKYAHIIGNLLGTFS